MEPSQPCAAREFQASDAALRYGTASAGFSQLILGAVFPVGLIITVLTGAELFTGDAMLAPMAAFIHKVSWAQVINLWLWVYIGNLIGSIVFAYICANGPFVSFDAAGVGTVTAFGTRAIAIAGAKTSYVGMMGFYSAFLKGIACNWLVNLAILLGICADDAVGKFFGIWFPIMAFVSSGFEHSRREHVLHPGGYLYAGFHHRPDKDHRKRELGLRCGRQTLSRSRSETSSVGCSSSVSSTGLRSGKRSQH